MCLKYFLKKQSLNLTGRYCVILFFCQNHTRLGKSHGCSKESFYPSKWTWSQPEFFPEQITHFISLLGVDFHFNPSSPLLRINLDEDQGELREAAVKRSHLNHGWNCTIPCGVHNSYSSNGGDVKLFNVPLTSDIYVQTLGHFLIGNGSGIWPSSRLQQYT